MNHACLTRNLLPILLVLTMGIGCRTPQSGSSPEAAAAAGSLAIPAPDDPEMRAYLGLAAGVTEFTLADLKAEVLVVDCFDLYCPTCQKGARYINRLYALIEARGLSGQIKVVGLGVGNTPMETEAFVKKYGVPFPAFPDRSNALARQFGEVRLPGLVVIRPGDPPLVLHRSSGLERDPEALLESILQTMQSGPAASHAGAAGGVAAVECEPGEECSPTMRAAAP